METTDALLKALQALTRAGNDDHWRMLATNNFRKLADLLEQNEEPPKVKHKPTFLKVLEKDFSVETHPMTFIIE